MEPAEAGGEPHLEFCNDRSAYHSGNVACVRRVSMDRQPSSVETAYDRVAAEYAAHFLGELAYKPLDRALLDCFAEEVRGHGPVGDIGCGPGQVARYLSERGLTPVGIDLSEQMVAQARQHHPAITFHQGSMLDLDVADGAWAGLVALYCIIHLEPRMLSRAFAEFYRVVRPDGLVLLSFHVGQERRHLDEWWGHPVDLDFLFFERPAVEHLLQEAGFTIQASLERQPYIPREVATQRAYLLARKPPMHDIQARE
jgi:SAM-dependent methyltransferase